ncbi:hypothetical protein [Psychrobacter sanguinis]|uniref:Pilus assembly protein PapC n=1 Tax=Psychrobacter sanguinis TaxID=861445 RepID=A0A844LXH0_9GAMM|nr:hypothetical protein [Psychrobacter sanguinis]MUG31303.1 hypothetical protein [Psychrobacter sanguinis]
MMTKQTTLRLMILASISSMDSLSLTSFAATLSNSGNTSSVSTVSEQLKPSLVGVFINGQEVDAVDMLYDARVNELSENNTTTGPLQANTYYFLSKDDLIRLTGVTFEPSTQNNQTDQIAKANTLYLAKTPIGDAKLTESDIIKKDNKEYLALSSLKKLGITADYNQANLAINLNMGWRPESINNGAAANNKDNTEKLPIDYYPSKAGLLGLSFDSSLNVSETRTAPNQPQSTNRNIYANVGAFGYGLGGVWGAKAVGVDSHSENINNDKFKDTAVDGFSTLPSDWEIDNLYWAKSGEKVATRLGINQPNSLGQGAQTSGSEFTGALIAYSNRDIGRHLSYFDDNSSSLLQNTSQDYQHIIGTGEPGGVAELRIDGRAVARVQISLDGRYEFLNLDVSQLNLTDTLVEIAIFAYPLARQPLEVRPIFLGKRRTNAATNELLIEAGIGRAGNAFNSDSNDNHETAAHVYAEYGLNNRMAVRGGVNTNLQNNSSDSDDSVSWHTGLNYSPSTRSNIDLSYANTPNQELWQAQLQYHLEKLWANYQYNLREYDNVSSAAAGSQRDERHQLFLNYQPTNRTNITLNQYYEDIANNLDSESYYAYAGINHQFSNALNGGLNWDTRGDRYNYRLSWQDINRQGYDNRVGQNTVGLSGDNDSDTLSLRHQFNDQTSLGQSISYRHGHSNLLYQGDINHRFDGIGLGGGSPLSTVSNLLSLGYSLYDNQIGWQADWQLTHQNSVNVSIGYKHKYVDSISTERLDGLIIDDVLIRDKSLPAWTQNNYLYARLSFDMFKAPKQNLKLGNYPRQSLGSVIIDIAHPAEPKLDSESMQFTLDNQKVQSSLLGSSDTSSQYLISNIKAGEYTLNMDAKDLPLEYSTSKLPTPRIRVINYAPTSVPMGLQKTYGISGKVADAKQGIEIGIYQGNQLVQSIVSGNFGYFQVFGLPAATYILKSPGYQEQKVVIDNDFVMQIVLPPEN